MAIANNRLPQGLLFAFCLIAAALSYVLALWSYNWLTIRSDEPPYLLLRGKG